MAALSFYGGWGLATGKEWSVVRRARFMLWLTGPIGVLIVGVIPWLTTIGIWKALLDVELMGAVVASSLAVAVWTMYLSKSKRVSATYAKAINISTSVIDAAQAVLTNRAGSQSHERRTEIPRPTPESAESALDDDRTAPLQGPLLEIIKPVSFTQPTAQNESNQHTPKTLEDRLLRTNWTRA